MIDMMRATDDGKPHGAGRVMMDLAPGERVAIGGGITVEVVSKSGRVARLCITAPRAIAINKSAANGGADESGTKRGMMRVPGG